MSIECPDPWAMALSLESAGLGWEGGNSMELSHWVTPLCRGWKNQSVPYHLRVLPHPEGQRQGQVCAGRRLKIVKNELRGEA